MPDADASRSKARRPAELSMCREPLDAEGSEDGALTEAAAAARAALIERVAELDGDGEVAELYLEEQVHTQHRPSGLANGLGKRLGTQFRR
eukprot:4816801-Prymnesium_polylepis.1